MNIPQLPSRPTLLATLAITFAALGMSGEALAAGTASERSNIEVMIRQLNAVEAVAQRSAELPAEDGARYRMDYTRLAADIARIRQGLEGYLAPSRAQPRDPVELSGSYQHEAASP